MTQPQPFESSLSIAACTALLTTLNTRLRVADITRLTPAELASFTIIPPSGAAPRRQSKTTMKFTAYLWQLQGTKAYHSDPYIVKVEEWADGMPQMRLQPWADREWTTGVFSQWRIGQEEGRKELLVKFEAKIAEIQAEREKKKEDINKEREEEITKTMKGKRAEIDKDMEAKRVQIEKDMLLKMAEMQADREKEKEDMKKEREGIEKTMKAKMAQINKDIEAKRVKPRCKCRRPKCCK